MMIDDISSTESASLYSTRSTTEGEETRSNINESEYPLPDPRILNRLPSLFGENQSKNGSFNANGTDEMNVGTYGMFVSKLSQDGADDVDNMAENSGTLSDGVKDAISVKIRAGASVSRCARVTSQGEIALVIGSLLPLLANFGFHSLLH